MQFQCDWAVAEVQGYWETWVSSPSLLLPYLSLLCFSVFYYKKRKTKCQAGDKEKEEVAR